jgi:sugar lactone lactonase YvrE
MSIGVSRQLVTPIYVADFNNSRIQRYRLGNTTSGTTVAGGNGNRQLNLSDSVYVSKKAGDIYIADRSNHRIQRLSPGTTSGVTIISITVVSGMYPTMLANPSNIILNKNETYLYASDQSNHRVQRYKLP